MFKAGDRMLCVQREISDHPYAKLTLGKVYTALEDENDDCVRIADDAMKHCAPSAHRFVSVPEDPRTGTNAVSRGDMVNSPSHYVTPGYAFEVIDAIEAWGLNYRCGAVVKYVARHLRKGKPLQDLRKAAWYLQREIAKREEAGEE